MADLDFEHPRLTSIDDVQNAERSDLPAYAENVVRSGRAKVASTNVEVLQVEASELPSLSDLDPEPASDGPPASTSSSMKSRYGCCPLLTVVSVTGCNPLGVCGGRSRKLIGAYAGDDRCGDLRQLAKEDR